MVEKENPFKRTEETQKESPALDNILGAGRKETEEQTEKVTDLSALKQKSLQKPDKTDYKSKNMYLKTENVRRIEKYAKKAGKSHSQYVDDLLTDLFSSWE